MPFTQLFSADINSKGNYTKRVKVLLLNEPEKEPSYWVDIRTHYEDEERKIATKFGVCISPQELNTLLPLMMTFMNQEIDGGSRRIWFKKSEKPYLYDLTVRKLSGTESTITMSKKEIQQLNFIRDKVFANCDVFKK